MSSVVSPVTDLSSQEAVLEMQRAMQARAAQRVAEPDRDAANGADTARATGVDGARPSYAVTAEVAAMAAAAQAQRAANRTASTAQTAEAGLRDVETLLTRMRSLAAQAVSDTMSPDQRTDCDALYKTLGAQVRALVRNTQYDGQTLLDGSGYLEEVMLPDASPAERLVADSRIDTQWDGSIALARLNRAIADVGSMRQHLCDSAFSLQGATIRTLDQQVDLAGADAMTVDTAYAIATNALVSARVQMEAAHLVAVVANQMPTAALALLYFNGAANTGR